MTTCEPKAWNECPPGSRMRTDALVLRAFALGHRSIVGVARFSGLTDDEAEEAVKRLARAGRLDARGFRRTWRKMVAV